MVSRIEGSAGTIDPPTTGAQDESPAPGSYEDLQRPGRDAVATRRALVRAARRRFATEGYRATTVRRIAADAGVNVALINRYFTSKEGLFEACIRRTSNELDLETPAPSSDLPDVVGHLVAHVANSPDGDDPLQLILLLRSSGDANADRIRRATLEHYTRKLAAHAGWRADDSGTDAILLRAQVAMATMMGVVMLRTSASVEPMASAGSEDLGGPLGEVLRLLLAQTGGREGQTTDVPSSSPSR